MKRIVQFLVCAPAVVAITWAGSFTPGPPVPSEPGPVGVLVFGMLALAVAVFTDPAPPRRDPGDGVSRGDSCGDS